VSLEDYGRGLSSNGKVEIHLVTVILEDEMSSSEHLALSDPSPGVFTVLCAHLIRGPVYLFLIMGDLYVQSCHEFTHLQRRDRLGLA
jgi:hypothetical protein